MKLLFLLIFGLAGALGPLPQPGPLDLLPPCNFTADAEMVEVGAVVLNLQTGRGCADNLDTPFHVASVPKLFIAGAYLDMVARGQSSFRAEKTFTYDYYMAGRGDCLTEDMVGQSLRLGFLSDYMISCSDNAATWMLMDAIGRDTVQAYIDRLGIPGIGPVIPYAEVDQRKLALIDPRWATVPTGVASRFYRGRITTGLVPAYFPEVPDYEREERRAANAQYYATYNTNTATPRAVAEFLLRQRDYLRLTDTPEQQAAWWLMNTMMLTQRQYSAQALPGTVYVGAKNGFDLGLRAEVNVIFDSLQTREPMAIALVFTRQRDLTGPDTQTAGGQSGILNDYLLELSPRIRDLLFPGYSVPRIDHSPNINWAVFNTDALISACWDEFAGDDAALAACWQALPSVDTLPTDTTVGMGLALVDLFTDDTRLTLTFTAPDGRQFSYQREAFQLGDVYIYWRHPLDQAGIWQMDVYQNLRRVYAHYILVGS